MKYGVKKSYAPDLAVLEVAFTLAALGVGAEKALTMACQQHNYSPRQYLKQFRLFRSSQTGTDPTVLRKFTRACVDAAKE